MEEPLVHVGTLTLFYVRGSYTQECITFGYFLLPNKIKGILMDTAS